MLDQKISTEFEQIFADFDTDGNGFISKDEMYYFVLELLGIDIQSLDFKKMKTQKQKVEISPEVEELLAKLKMRDEEMAALNQEIDKQGGALKIEVEAKEKELA